MIYMHICSTIFFFLLNNLFKYLPFLLCIYLAHHYLLHLIIFIYYLDDEHSFCTYTPAARNSVVVNKNIHQAYLYKVIFSIFSDYKEKCWDEWEIKKLEN